MKIWNLFSPVYLFENRSLIMPGLVAKSKRYLSNIHRLLRAQGISVTANDRRVAALKGRHQGRRCFIIGGGPSLKIEDLDRLSGELTFACNKIYLAFDETEWRPTYYSVLDVLVAENNKDVIRKLDLCKIFHEDVKPFFPEAEDTIWLKRIPEPFVGDDRVGSFSTNAFEGVYGGWTVIFPQIQLAFYMGIREIYLIGVDFSFDVPPPTGRECAHGEILEHQGELNHFHPEYRKLGETWTMPQLDLQYKAYLAAKKEIEINGGRIMNASRKTALDVFPLVDFDSIVK